eukprot:6187449-Pleurochrysis_carterae.AAC.4
MSTDASAPEGPRKGVGGVRVERGAVGHKGWERGGRRVCGGRAEACARRRIASWWQVHTRIVCARAWMPDASACVRALLRRRLAWRGACVLIGASGLDLELGSVHVDAQK